MQTPQNNHSVETELDIALFSKSSLSVLLKSNDYVLFLLGYTDKIKILTQILFILAQENFLMTTLDELLIEPKF